jgi:hypothetical protein
LLTMSKSQVYNAAKTSCRWHSRKHERGTLFP